MAATHSLDYTQSVGAVLYIAFELSSGKETGSQLVVEQSAAL
jgi:hypothetical protein